MISYAIECPAAFSWIRRLAWFILLGLGSVYSDSFQIEPGREFLLGESLSLARDAGGKMTLSEVREKTDTDFFMRSGHPIPSFGYTSDAIWLYVALENSREIPQSLLLNLQIARLREVDWFFVVNGEVVQTRSEGIDRPVLELNRSRFPMFPVELPEQSVSEVFVRIVSDHALFVPLKGASAEHSFVLYSRWNFMDNLFLGFGLAMIVFALLVSLAHPGAGFVYLAAITFFYQTYYMIFHGYLDWFLPGLPPWFHRQLLLIAISMAYSLLMVFTRKYLLCHEISSAMDRWLKWGIGLCFVSVFVLGTFPFSVGIHVVMIMNAAVYFSGLTLSIWQFSHSRTLSEGCFLAAWLWICMTLISFIFQIYIPVLGHLHPVMITRLIIPMMYFFFLAANLQRQFSARTERENVLKARQAAVRANLDALRYQLNPHFLFNALNSVDALSRVAPEKVPNVVQKLATFLRLRLKPAKTGLLPLEEEIIICSSYLDIEKIRFEERLQVTWNVEDTCLSFLVPEMILQPLIENAVKHGFRQNENLAIEISAYLTDGRMCVSVRNTGKVLASHKKAYTQTDSEGLGLKNLMKRLRYIYGSQAEFMLYEDDDWVFATVKIPAKKAPNESYSIFNY